MPHEDNRWRDKYRNIVSQQEQLEQTLKAQQALLHRTVAALSQAAEGHDTEVDKRLSAIRGSLKSNDVGGFDRMLKSLERVTTEADSRKQSQWSGVAKGLGNIAEQLKSHSPNKDHKSAIKDYKKRIPKGELLPVTLKRLLEELEQLVEQQTSLEGHTDKGLMSRLFSNKQDDAQTIQPATQEEQDWEAIDESTLSQNMPELVGELVTDEEPAPKHRQRTIPESVHERPVHEPAFSKISDRVTIILDELLEHFPCVPCVEQKAAKVRERIDRGLNWYELAPALEDIRDFIIQSHLGTDDNYRVYLKNVYAELNHITQELGVAIEHEEQQRLAQSTLHNNVSEGMQGITQALTQQNNIDQLKHAVQAQVQSIQSALKNSQQQVPSEQDSLSSQLGSLIERVKKMEQQDTNMREQLEIERNRAITDTLTGLPNREAYSEKVHEEMLRWQRYQHPLCMAVLDIDFFKKINDNYGHQTGDKVLKAVSTSVAQRLREVDFMARFGGEEFVMLLPETSAENALGMLNRTRERLAKTHMRSKNEQGEETKFTVTVSIGIAEFTEGDTAENVFERADKALYDAKENGRNQCRLGSSA